MAIKKSKKKVGIVYSAPKPKFKHFHKFLKKTGIRSDFSIESIGNYALKSLEFGRITSHEIEASKKFIKKIVKKKGKLYVRVYPYLPLTKKPGETRMGKGKGSRVSSWVSPIYAGKILFELKATRNLAMKVFAKVREKISLVTRTVRLVR
jgi:large subunit ribosomal protein L16